MATLNIERTQVHIMIFFFIYFFCPYALFCLNCCPITFLSL